MKRTSKVLLTLLCAFALMAGTAVATGVITTRTLQAQFMDIQLKVDGAVVTPKDVNGASTEPFMVDGTVYVPARAIGEALGRGVEWDADTRTVSLISPYLQDARALVAAVEASHPAFALDDVPQGYEAAKAAFLEAAAKPGISKSDFAWAVLAYTASMKDGHTSAQVFGNSGLAVLDIGWVAEGEHLYLTDAKGNMTKKEVTAIGGLPTAQVFSAIDTYFTAENESARDYNRTRYAAFFQLLARAGAEVDTVNESLVVSVRDESAVTQRTVKFHLPQAEETAVVAWEKKDGVFYVDLNQCILNDDVKKAADELKAAVDGGLDKVVLDVRGNGGGDSNACYLFLQAMGMEIPQYGVYVRFSELALDANQPYERGYTLTEGGDRYEPTLETAKPNPKVKLVVLTDEGSYSSATMLGVWVQDGKLGTVIGRPSTNAPSSYGDILYFNMDSCGITATISHKQWLRPDAAADQKTLVPDVQTKLGEDALQTALDFLKTK